MGARLSYNFNDSLALNYGIANGTQQTEPFNGFKDQFFGLTFQPHKSVSWNVNYYLGQEHPDLMFLSGSFPAGLPTQQGLPFRPIRPAPNGRLHIFDSYMTWQASTRLTFSLEADYVIQRLWSYSAPQYAYGGAGYARYRLTPRFALVGRSEYLGDRGDLFSGAAQALKETTLTTDFRLADGFLVRGEWRRDFSNHPFLAKLFGYLEEGTKHRNESESCGGTGRKEPGRH